MGALENVTGLGVTLTLEDGVLYASPLAYLTDEIRAFIRDNKPQLIAELTGQRGDTCPPFLELRPNKILSIMDANLALIRAYLSAPREAGGYGETDESTLTEVMERCRVAPDFYEAWLRDARAWKAAQAVTLPRPNVTHSLPPKVTQCTTCKHLKKGSFAGEGEILR